MCCTNVFRWPAGSKGSLLQLLQSICRNLQRYEGPPGGARGAAVWNSSRGFVLLLSPHFQPVRLMCGGGSGIIDCTEAGMERTAMGLMWRHAPVLSCSSEGPEPLF